MIVVFTAAAYRDLEEIGDNIAKRNPARAATFIDEIKAKTGNLADFPGAAPARPQWGEGLRISLHKSYVIVHRVVGETVQILRVVHGRRDLDSLFDDDAL